VQVCDLARGEDFDVAEVLFNRYLPLVRYEQQPGIGLAICKEVLRRRGAIGLPSACRGRSSTRTICANSIICSGT